MISSMKINEISVLSGIGILFVVLKLCAVINWSWWIVLCPIGIQALMNIIIYIWWESKSEIEKFIWIRDNIWKI